MLPGKGLDDAVGVVVFVRSAESSKANNAITTTSHSNGSNTVASNRHDILNANCTIMNANSKTAVTGGVLAV